MYSDVFRMYPRARVGKPSDTIKIQHARCEYKRILAHEGSMTLRYKVGIPTLHDTSKIQAGYSRIQMYPRRRYRIQSRYKQNTVQYTCIPNVSGSPIINGARVCAYAW